MKTLARKRSSLKSETRALSLQVIQCEVNEDEPVPLKMYDPNSSPEKCIRRSERFTTNKYRRSPTEQSAESWDSKSAHALRPGDLVKCLRRSPRLAGGNDGRELNLEKPIAVLDSNLIEWRDSSEKRLRSEVNAVNSGVREVGEKCLRSRMVPARVYERASRDSSNEPPSKKVKTLSARADVIRRSPRFSSPSVGAEKSNANRKSPSSLKRSSERTRTNLGKTDSHVLGERCLRSRTVPVLLIGSEENVDPKYSLSDRKTRGKTRSCDSLLALPAPPPSSARQSSKRPKTTLGKCDSNFLGGRCLRSRTVPVPLGGTEEDVESKSAFVDLPDVSADRKPTEKIRNALGSSVSDVSGQSLRSRITLFRRVETEDVETKSAVIELPNIFGDEKQTEKMNTAFGGCDLDDGMVEKCLRSRKVPFFVAWTENGDTKPAVVTSSDVSGARTRQQKIKALALSEKKEKNKKSTGSFVGEPVPDEEARERWGWRYELKSQRSKCQIGKLNADEEDEIILNVECHYTKAKVDCCIFNLGDCVYIKGNGRQKHIGRILEFFRTTDCECYFRVQWFFRAEDTVMKNEAAFHDKKRLFYSDLMNDNLLDCIVSKVNVTRVAPTLGLQWLNFLPPSDFYYDMEYRVEYSTFRTLLTERHELYTPDDNTTCLEDMPRSECYKAEWALLDLYSGCGGMSTGLCLGAKLSSVNLVTRWAVDADRSACDSLKLNHPETQVRNQAAEDFLGLLKGWEKLCQQYVFNNLDKTPKFRAEDTREIKNNVNSPSGGEYEVLSLVDICFGDPSNTGEHGLKFKVRWKGYSSSEDTWEPIEGLSNCQERIQDFVRSGLKSKILPLPGDVDVLCGGPPCQGISGYNRFRNTDAPLTDERNHQIVVFMDIVKFLMPKYVLMENVVDIIKFDKASLARYALSRLVHMKYQARLGTIAAGCYGLPQFRLRVFLWGALPSERLPQFPLPTHDVVVKYWPPLEFERNTVAYDEGEPRELEKAIILRDAISDLPAVTNHDNREQRTYDMPPETEFQKYIRLTKDEMMGLATGVIDAKKPILYDHRTFKLSENNYLRVCQIPHKKGANFRDLPGVVVGDDNVASWDSSKEPMMLSSGKPLVPDCVFTYEQGKSKRPYARLWWDETVSTVVTFPNVRSQAVLHPEQDRVLTIREFARLQGFPDFYRFCGTVKERYCQVGNAVAVPVGRALGYTLGRAIRKLGGDEPLMTLPPKFAFQRHPTTD